MAIYTSADIADLSAGKSISAQTEPYTLNTNFQLYPPWFDAFQRVLVCQNGRWKIDEVCGVNESNLDAGNLRSRLPDTPKSYGQSADGSRYCNATSTPTCTTQSNQLGSPNGWDANKKVSEVNLTCLSQQCETHPLPLIGNPIDDCTL
jgi:hypothetical protein